MPNPLSLVKRGANIVMNDDVPVTSAIGLRLLQIINAWTRVDLGCGLILAALLGAQSHVGAAIYAGLSGGAARRAVLKSAASASLGSAEDLELFSAVLAVESSLAKKRNDLVHNHWATSPELPDDLLVMSQPGFLAWQASRFTASLIQGDGPPPWVAWTSVYKPKELDALLARIRELTGCLGSLETLIRGPEPARVRSRIELYASSIVAK